MLSKVCKDNDYYLNFNIPAVIQNGKSKSILMERLNISEPVKKIEEPKYNYNIKPQHQLLKVNTTHVSQKVEVS